MRAHLTIYVDKEGLLHPSINQRGADGQTDTVGYTPLHDERGYAISNSVSGKVLTGWHSSYQGALEELVKKEKAAWAVKKVQKLGKAHGN